MDNPATPLFTHLPYSLSLFSPFFWPPGSPRTRLGLDDNETGSDDLLDQLTVPPCRLEPTGPTQYNL